MDVYILLIITLEKSLQIIATICGAPEFDLQRSMMSPYGDSVTLTTITTTSTTEDSPIALYCLREMASHDFFPVLVSIVSSASDENVRVHGLRCLKVIIEKRNQCMDSVTMNTTKI
jgi:hypothetical protein